MSILLVCNGVTHKGRRVVIGCMERRTAILCGRCEKIKGKIYEDCAWSPFGGKKIPELNGQPHLEKLCYWCKLKTSCAIH